MGKSKHNKTVLRYRESKDSQHVSALFFFYKAIIRSDMENCCVLTDPPYQLWYFNYTYHRFDSVAGGSRIVVTFLLPTHTYHSFRCVIISSFPVRWDAELAKYCHLVFVHKITEWWPSDKPFVCIHARAKILSRIRGCCASFVQWPQINTSRRNISRQWVTWQK